MKGYKLEDLYQSINDIFYQYDEGRMSQTMAVALAMKCCKAFINGHDGWTERDGVPMFVPPKESE